MQKARKVGSSLFLVGLLVALLVAFIQRQAIYDWWRLKDYEPPQRIAALADATTMNDHGRKLFYIYHPELDNEEAFNNHCREAEQSIVLGCYVSQRGLYIFDVKEPRLNGIHEVTAAHEMLHVAYERLSPEEKTRIDGQLQAVFSKLDDERIKTTMEAYRKRDPSIVNNELHSILATEVRRLTPELDDYYSRYFTDRLRIVTLSEQYEKVFTNIKELVARYDAQLKRLRMQIEAGEKELTNRAAALQAERARLDTMLRSGQNEQYNAAVPGFNARVREYNTLIAATRQQITEFNETVQARNAVALEQLELIKALDSRLAPQAQE